MKGTVVCRTNERVGAKVESRRHVARGWLALVQRVAGGEGAGTTGVTNGT